MRLPRDLSGSDLAQALRKLGYSITRQAGVTFDSPLMSMASIISRSHNIRHFASAPSQLFLPMWAHILNSLVTSYFRGCLAKHEPIPEVFHHCFGDLNDDH